MAIFDIKNSYNITTDGLEKRKIIASGSSNYRYNRFIKTYYDCKDRSDKLNFYCRKKQLKFNIRSKTIHYFY